jgi:hypothetical protein
MSWNPTDARLPIPGTNKAMSVAELRSFFDLDDRALAASPLLVAFVGQDIRCVYDERALARAFRDEWGTAQPIIDAVQPENAYERLRALQKVVTPAPDAQALREHIEVSLIEATQAGTPASPGVIAALVLLVLQLELRRALAK